MVLDCFECGSFDLCDECYLLGKRCEGGHALVSAVCAIDTSECSGYIRDCQGGKDSVPRICASCKSPVNQGIFYRMSLLLPVIVLNCVPNDSLGHIYTNTFSIQTVALAKTRLGLITTTFAKPATAADLAAKNQGSIFCFLTLCPAATMEQNTLAPVSGNGHRRTASKKEALVLGVELTSGKVLSSVSSCFFMMSPTYDWCC